MALVPAQEPQLEELWRHFDKNGVRQWDTMWFARVVLAYVSKLEVAPSRPKANLNSH